MSHTISSSSHTVVCDGALNTSAERGHPRIYLALPDSGQVTCPYCSRVFTAPQHTSSCLPDDASEHA